MTINQSKTEVVVFRNGGSLPSYERWSYNGVPVNITIYKYLGLIFTPKHILGLKQKQNLLHKPQSIFAINSYQITLDIFLTMNIQNYLILEISQNEAPVITLENSIIYKHYVI
jgi:hypothetical protein